ncbi:MAG: transglycosylase SLT domain-containing protein [Salinisphaeraceae bacterium]|nr:transglycosylase SLT domain-containing protein [Salinisphaeraceae bacterium]
MQTLGVASLACLLSFAFYQPAALADSRSEFKAAYKAVSAGQARAQNYSGLQNYVLYPYLVAAELDQDLRKRPGPATDQKLRDFLSRYGQQPATQSVRSSWLAQLANRGAWADFLAFMPERPGEKTQCRAALAHIKLKRPEALAAASELWVHGGLRDKACIPVFEWLESSGNLSQALVEGRIALAREAGNSKVVAFLVAKLRSGPFKRQAQLWLQGYNSPHEFVRAYIGGSHRDADAQTLQDIFKRSTRLSPNTGAAKYDAFIRKAVFNKQISSELAAWVGYRKILNRHPDALAWYQRAGDAVLDETQRLWWLRSAVRVQDWRAIRSLTDRMTEAEAQDSRWQYWRARALEALGDNSAGSLYKSLAAERSYYGFMAADRVGADYHIVDRPVAKNPAMQSALLQRPEVQRARELFALDMRQKGREEWKLLLDSTDALEQQQAAVLALDWGWYSQAALTMGRAKYWDEMATRFPVIYKNDVQAAAKRERIPTGWIYGIMRSESLFVPDIRSYAGAVGLMQLMPGTGKLVAGKMGIGWRGTSGLEDPSYNIRLGSRYLRMMLDKFDQHFALATASYNAGPGNAIRWLDDSKRLPADVWIETVPFNATHAYLLHVLEYTAVYEWRLTGKPLSLKKLLPPVPSRNDVD